MRRASWIVPSIALLASSPAHPDAPVDAVAELRKIGTTFLANDKSKPSPRTMFVRGPTCAAVAAGERAKIERRVAAWIDKEHPDEKADADADLSKWIDVGCKDPAGFVGAAVAQDRRSRTREYGMLRRNYILRVFADKIDSVEERTSTSSAAWSEWADEGGLWLIGQIDLDGDGALDLIVGRYEHEGGSQARRTQIAARFANGTVRVVANVDELERFVLIDKQIVIESLTREGRSLYACVGKDLKVAPCAASAALTKLADRLDIASRYKDMTSSALPDRELLAAELAVLGIKPAPGLLAAVPQAAPIDRVKRHVARWAADAGLRYAFEEHIVAPQPEARAYFDRLEASLGDAPCTRTPLSDADRAAIEAWVKRQDAKPQQVAIEPAPCGPYAWAAWGAGERREVLFARDGTTRLLGFTWTMDMPGGSSFVHVESFFAHGGAIVGVIVHDKNLWIVSDGKVVAQSHGDIAFYDYGGRTRETSRDIVRDGGTLWHATPTGRDKLDVALVRDHEARRAALAVVLDGEPSGDAKYVAALKLLGAPAALVAEARALAAAAP
jgi:hypothetical protein